MIKNTDRPCRDGYDKGGSVYIFDGAVLPGGQVSL